MQAQAAECEVSTTCVSGWVMESTRREWVFDPPAHAGGTDFITRVEQAL